jgi:hypothetical protein
MARESEISRVMSEFGRRRWDATGDDPAAVGRLGGLAARGKSGRPRSRAKRCPCGEMTAKRAKARGHRCSTC